jgi:hypothetical protein
MDVIAWSLPSVNLWLDVSIVLNWLQALRKHLCESKQRLGSWHETKRYCRGQHEHQQIKGKRQGQRPLVQLTRHRVMHKRLQERCVMMNNIGERRGLPVTLANDFGMSGEEQSGKRRRLFGKQTDLGLLDQP